MNLVERDIINFKNVARDVQSRGLSFDRSVTKDNYLVKQLYDTANSYHEYFVSSAEEIGLSRFVDELQIIPPKYKHLLNSNDYFIGDYDLEHVLLLHSVLLKEVLSMDTKNSLFALLYYVAAKQFETELKSLASVLNGSKITPVFELNHQNFRWRRCECVSRKYMLHLCKPEGYTCYYLEKKSLAHIALVMSLNIVGEGKNVDTYSFSDAEKFIAKQKCGSLIAEIPFDLEELLLSMIAGGRLPFKNEKYANDSDSKVILGEKALNKSDSIYTGYFGRKYCEKNMQIVEDIEKCGASSLSNLGIYNVYKMYMMPIMIGVMGKIMTAFLTDVKEEGYNQTDCYIYHVTPNRFGIAVRDGLSLNDISPKYSGFFNEVRPLTPRNMAFGEYL